MMPSLIWVWETAIHSLIRLQRQVSQLQGRRKPWSFLKINLQQTWHLRSSKWTMKIFLRNLQRASRISIVESLLSLLTSSLWKTPKVKTTEDIATLTSCWSHMETIWCLRIHLSKPWIRQLTRRVVSISIICNFKTRSVSWFQTTTIKTMPVTWIDLTTACLHWRSKIEFSLVSLQFLSTLVLVTSQAPWDLRNSSDKKVI